MSQMSLMFFSQAFTNLYVAHLLCVIYVMRGDKAKKFERWLPVGHLGVVALSIYMAIHRWYA